MHWPHSRQVTGARCTEVAACQTWVEYSSRPTTDSRHQGWAIKDFSVLSEMCSICEQPLYGIMLMILHTNKWCVLISEQNLQIFFKSIWKIPSASRHSRCPFTSCRTCPSWHNGSSLGPHVLNAYGSMTLATTNTIYGKHDPALVDMWGTSYQSMKYQSSLHRRVITGGSEKTARVSRRTDCWIGVIKFYVSANNQKVTSNIDHVCGFMCCSCVELKLMNNTRSLSNQALKSEHHCCSAPVVGLEEYRQVSNTRRTLVIN